MDALINFQSNKFEILNFRYSGEDEASGNPYNCTFDLHIVSGCFNGYALCEYDIKEFRRFVNEIGELYRFERNRAELNDICYGSNAVFELDKTGHIKISGVIYGEERIQSLKYEMEIDQTALTTFLRDLKLLIA